MAWYIVAINADTPRTTVLFQPGNEFINPTGGLVGNYILAFPSLGYVTLIDNGDTGALKIAL